MNYKYAKSKADQKASRFHSVTIILIILIVSLFYSKAHATDWTGEEIAKEIAFQGLNIADFYLTDRIMKDGGEEVGLIKAVIGSHPDTDTLIIAAGLTAVGHYFISEYLINNKPQYTAIWQNISIGVKGLVVGFNYKQTF